ncbi:hypothetical protein SCHPADRAFT_943775 [Schizopora paradoxa]|uniref:Galactose-binding like protein n=1 Tax=Schizopora paradoxa TaxID=27342 RepID=A0A0H2RBS1_9AGAM|nr:hypothetical protein SCHPADRAFT_943775 [Schizopora paradoxa]
MTQDTANIEPLLNKESRTKVSSTLDKSVGKKHLTDGSPETCWTSKQNLPQFVSIDFDQPVIPKVVHFTFQGGFVGTRCKLYGRPGGGGGDDASSTAAAGEEILISDQIYPEDNNRAQVFDLPENLKPIKHLKFVFEESSDMFGRITIYNMQIYGRVLEEAGQDAIS